MIGLHLTYMHTASRGLISCGINGTNIIDKIETGERRRRMPECRRYGRCIHALLLIRTHVTTEESSAVAAATQNLPLPPVKSVESVKAI